MKTNYKISFVSLLMVLTTGCASVPGSDLQGVENTAVAALQNVKISVINPQLLTELKQKNAKQTKYRNKGISTKGYDYKLGIGDVLSIGVWDHPELTIPAAVQRTAAFDGFRVQADGTLTYAYAVKMPAAGKTISQLHGTLVKKLSRIIEKPQVDIKVVGFNSQKAYVTGEVNKPGVYAITEIPLTLIDALNQAGGLSEKADWRTVTFTRGNKTEIIKLDDIYTRGDRSQNRLLQHGDIIHVNHTDSQKVFVLGDVIKTGSVQVHRYGLSLAEAITEAGGLNEQTANASGIFVLRKSESKNSGIIADVYQLHAKNIVAMVMADQFKLQPRDIFYVTTAPVALWNRLISQLLPTVTAIDKLSVIGVRY